MKTTNSVTTTLDSGLGYEYAIDISADQCTLHYSDESERQTMEFASADEMERVAYEMLHCVGAYRKLRYG
jgi:hypothetical protein